VFVNANINFRVSNLNIVHTASREVCMSKIQAWASGVVLFQGENLVLIREYKREFPIYWKFPSGTNNKNDNNASDTAVRRVREKTGIVVPKVKFLFSKPSRFHMFYLFSAELDSIEGIKENNTDEREIEIFHKSELDTMVDLLPKHLRLWRRVSAMKNIEDLSLV